MQATKILIVLVLVVSIVSIGYVCGLEDDGIETKEAQRGVKAELLAIQADVKNLRNHAKAVESKVISKSRERPGLSSALKGVLGIVTIVPKILEGVILALEEGI